MKLKVCRLREPQNIEQVSRLAIDYIGLHFHKSSPCFTGDRISFDFARSIPKHIQKAGVFAGEDSYSVFSAIARYDLDLVQLQGNESAALCRELKPYVKVVKAFQLNDDFNFKILEPYMSHVDYFLFGIRSENGLSPDYRVLQRYLYETPFFLNGSIDGNFLRAIKQIECRQLFALDLNGGFETAPGLRDPSGLDAFIRQLRQNGHAG